MLEIPYRPPMSQSRKRGRAPERLIGYLRHRFRNAPQAVWFRFEGTAVAQRLRVSERTVWRAKAYLMEHAEHYGIRWITCRGAGQEGIWQVLVAPVDRLDYDRLPLVWHANGQHRHLRDWIQAADLIAAGSWDELHERPPSPPSETDRCRSYKEPEGSCLSKQGGPPAADALESPSGGKLDPGRPWEWSRTATDRDRRRYTHAIARAMGKLHWDNCAVRNVHPACRTVVQHLLDDGITPGTILNEYYAALVAAHKDATDAQLRSGGASKMILPSRVFAQVYRRCGYEPISTERGTIYMLIHDEDRMARNREGRVAWRRHIRGAA